MTDLVCLPFKIQVYVSHSGEYSYPPGWVDANCMFANNSKAGGGRNLWPSQERAQQAIDEMCRLSSEIIDTRWYRIVLHDTVSADKNDPYAIEIARILNSFTIHMPDLPYQQAMIAALSNNNEQVITMNPFPPKLLSVSIFSNGKNICLRKFENPLLGQPWASNGLPDHTIGRKRRARRARGQRRHA